MVECGGLENRFTRIPGDEGSNPSSSASKVKARPARAFFVAPATAEDSNLSLTLFMNNLFS